MLEKEVNLDGHYTKIFMEDRDRLIFNDLLADIENIPKLKKQRQRETHKKKCLADEIERAIHRLEEMMDDLTIIKSKLLKK